MVSFREVEKQFVIINDPKYVMLTGKKSEANSILCYGYVDHQAGLTYQMLASTLYEDGDYTIVDDAELISMKIRADSVRGMEIIPVHNKALNRKYADTIEITKIYYENEEVIKCREVRELDQFRHPEFPDDIQVLFIKEGLRPEGIWVRPTKLHGIDNGTVLLEGYMLNTPNGDFGVAGNQPILVGSGIVDEAGTRICFAVLNNQ